MADSDCLADRIQGPRRSNLDLQVYLKCETQLKDEHTQDILTYSNRGLSIVLTYPNSNH